MDYTRPYRIADVPGLWQYWADAPRGEVWLIPADAEAVAHLGERSFVCLPKQNLTQLPPESAPTLF